jgi:hypothetical protein
MHLTDTSGLYHFLGFDFDTSRGRAAIDAGRFCLWLEDLGIDHLVAESGPSGGRHVWIGLATPAPAPLVDAIARLAHAELPTLDVSPLTNARTGALRPPLAPHRQGGRSEILTGWPERLAARSVELEQLERLHAELAAMHGARPMPKRPRALGRATAGRDGELALNVPRRPLGPAARRLVDEGRPNEPDKSRTLAAVLAHLALAGYTFAEVLELSQSSPAFEHARTATGAAGGRRGRTRDEAAALLARQWRRTVSWAAATPRLLDGDDPSFDERAAAIARLSIAAQERADAMPGRWRNGTGRFSDRLVLDAICLIALEALRADVEVSTRRLSELTGLGRESCRTALHRLADEGWLSLEAAHEGTKAPRWRLRDFSTGGIDNDRSQVPPPPALPGGTALRNATLKRIRATLKAIAHDVFSAPGSLGRTAGRTFAQLRPDEVLDVGQLTQRVRLPASSVRRSLRKLTEYGLTARVDGGYFAPATDQRAAVAGFLGVAGYLEDRRERYEVEREAWAWWQAELERRHTRRRRRRQRATEPQLYSTLSEPTDYPIHPTRNGRADFAAALRAIREGILNAPTLADETAA